MRRWFRKKERTPEDMPEEALISQEEASEENGVALAEEGAEVAEEALTPEAEAPPAEETQAPELDLQSPPEAPAAEDDAGGPVPEAETAPASPRRGLFRRLFGSDEPLEEPAPVAEAPVPSAEEPLAAAEEVVPAAEEPLPAAADAVSAPAELQAAMQEAVPAGEGEVLEGEAPPEEGAAAGAPAGEGAPAEDLGMGAEPAAPVPLPLVEPPPLSPADPLEVMAPEDEEFIIDLEEEITEEAALETKKRRFRRFRERLVRTRQSLAGGLERLFLGRREVDAEVLEELEEILITADLGVDTALRLVEVIRDRVKRRELRDAARLKEALREEMVAILTGPPAPRRTAKPWVILMVGVNGVGKTTTIAKLAHQDRGRGLTPLLIAGDTFRAAAVEQLEIWGERVGAQVIKQKSGADPASVVFDGLDAAQARQVDVVYVDTAGRLHTKVNLMEELKKIHRTMAKKLPGTPHETLLILDATTGQNALSQARLFHEAVGVTGVILTKLDGTAKGGMALAVAHETGLPIRYAGVGEGMDDLQPFDPEAFVAAILD
jgi:fused signal recognition particle receptor